MRVWATAVAEGVGGRGAAYRPLMWVVAVVAVLAALYLLIGRAQDAFLMTSPAVQRAEVQARVAEEEYRTAELQRDTAAIRRDQATENVWQPWVAGVGHEVLIGLIVLVPLVLLIGTTLLFRRHMSLPTKDGRVPLVGLDRELSAEALFRYQALQSPGPRFEALPVGRSGKRLDALLESEETK
ncbi:hypothetical protein [Candidatus Nephthysia bennettiae]|uniref:Uncharacterized protein n=1 Tax=Candidatus Nephthysia bennettiae TaxID=3127016 RepID=A0A934K4R8_9BACT|nr:hypothetical protein [Candidatus Dormibacteraeota bacterium]MBJ7607126.1 hypothetical protein [Candidatus Dormibacteraeota bacterium]MBJ7613685.1 hypothetical protein [Candidatus Dormibacteraeota bacterium]